MRYLLAIAFVVSAGIGCKKKDADKADKAAKPSEDKAGDMTAPKPAAAGDDKFAAWDMPARKAAWQGAWAGEVEAAGWKAAFTVSGDKVHVVDKKGEKDLELDVTSPCTAALVKQGADGSKTSTIVTYTLKDGQLITGMGGAGSRKGDQAVVCGGGKIFTFDGKACTEWQDNFGKLESKPGECGFRKDGDKEVFFYKAGGSESTLLVEGDVIWSEQLKSTHATKHPDLAAARTAQGL